MVENPVVLLVEDDEAHAEMAEVVLSDLMPNIEVIRVRDGEEALEYIEGCFCKAPASRVRPDLILLDLRLPKVDGLEVLRQIKGRAATRRIPVVVLTTSGASADVDRAYDLGVNSYLVKPAGFENFTGLLGQFGEYWFGWNTRPALDVAG